MMSDYEYPSDEELRVYKQRLAERLETLDRLSESSREAREAVSLDQSRVGRLSRMDAIQMQEMERANEARRILERQRVERALTLIENGEYGDCVLCGEVIAPKRLKLDPSFIICVDCA